MTLEQAMRERRYARLIVGDDLVYKEPDKVASALSGVLIFRCEHEFSRRAFVYDICAPNLDPQGENLDPPTCYLVARGNLHTGGFLEITGDP